MNAFSVTSKSINLLSTFQYEFCKESNTNEALLYLQSEINEASLQKFSFISLTHFLPLSSFPSFQVFVKSYPSSLYLTFFKEIQVSFVPTLFQNSPLHFFISLSLELLGLGSVWCKNSEKYYKRKSRGRGTQT